MKYPGPGSLSTTALSSGSSSASFLTWPRRTSLSCDLTVSSRISGLLLKRASWVLRTFSAMYLLGVRLVDGSSMKGSKALSSFLATSSSTLASIIACSASSLKLISSRISPRLHCWQFLHSTQRYGESAPIASIFQRSPDGLLLASIL